MHRVYHHVSLCLTVWALTLAAPSALAQHYSSITIDGDPSDWHGLFQYNDAADAGTSWDIQSVFVANDETYMYFGVLAYGDYAQVNRIFLRLDTTGDGQEDTTVRLDIRNQNLACQRIRVDGTDHPCSDFALQGDFFEVRIPLASLGLSSSPVVGVVVEINGAGGPNDYSVGDGGFVTYDNTGDTVPTFAQLRHFSGAAEQGGARVRWRTSAEWFSAGIWLLRRLPNEVDWQPVGGGPQSVGMAAGGRGYEFFDPHGKAGDEYLLIEVDTRKRASTFGPITITIADAPPKAASGPEVRQGQSRGPRGSAVHSDVKPDVRGAKGIAHPLTRWAKEKDRLGDWLVGLPSAHAKPPKNLPPLKFAVHSEGLHVLCDDSLQAMGWGAVAAWGHHHPQLSVRGQAVSVWRMPAEVGGCKGLGFYAASPSSPHAPFDVYQLRATEGAPEFLELSLPTVGNPASPTTSVAQRFARVSRPRFIDMGDGAPNRFFWAYASPHVPLKSSVVLPHLVAPSSVQIAVSLRGLRHEAGRNHRLHLTLGNGERAEGQFVTPGWTTASLTVAAFSSESTDFELRLLANDDPFEGALIGGFEVTYDGALTMPAGQDSTLVFASTERGAFSVRSDHPSLLALDITHPAAATPLAVTALGPDHFAVHLPVDLAAGPRRIFVSGTSTVQRATLEKLVPTAFFEQPSTRGEYVVLGPALLLEEMEPLLQHRQARGFSVQAFSYAALYDHYTHSNPHPAAVARFVEQAQNTWLHPPRYVFLVGATSYDPWSYQDEARPADAPLQQVYLDAFGFRGFSDALLVSPQGAPKVAVGRLPTSDAAAVRAYVQKVLNVEQHISSVGAFDAAAMIAGSQRHVKDPNFATLAKTLSMSTGITAHAMASSSAHASSLIGRLWSMVDVVTYTGHGDVESWSDNVIAIDDAPSLVAARPPVVLSTGCMDSMVAAPNDSLGLSLLNGGAHAGASLVISPTSLTDPNIAAGFLARVIWHTRQQGTWGDGWLVAQAEASNPLVRTIGILGDPALASALPPHPTPQNPEPFKVAQQNAQHGAAQNTPAQRRAAVHTWTQTLSSAPDPARSGCSAASGGLGGLILLMLVGLLRRQSAEKSRFLKGSNGRQSAAK